MEKIIKKLNIFKKKINIFKKKNEFVTCPCKRKAEYRCQYRIQKEVFYHSTMKVEDLNKFEEPIKTMLTRLIPYWKCTSMESKSSVLQWTSCDKCIKLNVINYFTYVKDGWEENIKYHYEYENISL